MSLLENEILGRSSPIQNIIQNINFIDDKLLDYY